MGNPAGHRRKKKLARTNRDARRLFGEVPVWKQVSDSVRVAFEEIHSRYLASPISNDEAIVAGRMAFEPEAASEVKIVEMRSNVHGIGIRREPQPDGSYEYGLEVFLLRRSERSKTPSELWLPNSINNIPVRVAQSIPAITKPGDKGCMTEESTLARGDASTAWRPNFNKYRPLIAGGSIAHRDGGFGTIGYFVRANDSSDRESPVFVLTSRHVLNNLNQGRLGDPIVQPPLRPGSTFEEHYCADYSSGIGFETEGEWNQIDAGLAKLHKNHEFELEILDIGQLHGTMDPIPGFKVQKFGASTGLTSGIISHIAYSHRVYLDPDDYTRSIVFRGQIKINRSKQLERLRRPFVLPGDSGSLLVHVNQFENRTRAVGLIFASAKDGSYGVASPIQRVLRSLNVHLCVPEGHFRPDTPIIGGGVEPPYPF